jgi:hypothetical protein
MRIIAESNADRILNEHSLLKQRLEAANFQESCWVGFEGGELLFKLPDGPGGVLATVSRLSDRWLVDWILKNLEEIAVHMETTTTK